jgi:hypothetical protein
VMATTFTLPLSAISPKKQAATSIGERIAKCVA